MGTPEESIQQFDVRRRWKHEAHDFTPWLADNLHLLGEELGLKLRLERVEAPVGPFSCDIHAREINEDVSVAIENQLEWTDHSHLTQLLTYTAGLDARIGIWVAPEFRHEHAEALHWLNKWTSEEIRFYGVKIEVVKKTGDLSPEPRFRKVVYPCGWNKDLTQPPGATMSPEAEKYHEFFQPLIEDLVGECFADKVVQHFDHTGRFFPSRLDRDVGYAVSLEGKSDAWVTLHIRTESIERTNKMFDALYTDREKIESCFTSDKEWHWRRHDSFLFSSVNIRRDGSIDDLPEELKEIKTWMAANLRELQEVFEPRLAKILKEMPGTL